MTTPAPAAKIGVPIGAAQSTPVCMREKCRIGWKRMPKPEVNSPSAIGLRNRNLRVERPLSS